MKIKQLGYLSAALLLTLSACGNEGNNNDENGDDEEIVVIPVEATTVSRGDISAYYSNTATLEAEQEALVVAKVRGIINQVLVEEGDRVKAGQVIARIEDEQYRIEAERAKSNMDRLYNDFKRSKELYDKQAISVEEYQNKQFEYEAQKSAYELAKLNQEYTSIKSPISGVISERLIKKGNMIGTDQNVYRVTDFDPLQAILYVPEHEMAKINKNQPAEIKVDALPGQSFKAHVERISPIVDPTTGTFKVTVVIDEKSDKLKPGMFGRVKIVYDTRLSTKMIPKVAVMSEDETQTVFVVRDSLAYKKIIKTGYVNGSNIEILEGLEDGEVVVTTGQGSLKDSAKVNVVRS
ncbi:MAG: efflux RND transporter periplasmic adaptor subunit [Balneola sp.]|nr:efflux RND transporter periplasmic adaptor subunit [Balneola sp.]MBO6651355.1 efflux RND transporter periplasmic adaptor subunit [Balneola sp.]MBO6711019.1 efflux RND transporter periplasmic adaptor subunit [Balneola sp.]MBO6801535.1 efflux RND transporter periplasmic adaptor subunit [Balneola sp.]MBO6870439.1 efflux RND transporter periplasmic adaptor subunit [Balneola sp.]